ncbi:SIMPL domain-containing protein [Bacillus sp. DX1.1]|uniref:SIMPL domain-containing protein n=1 Tax=unclassified Bacillus (in: firmicutes) TaxID=185979 RepID=UPI002570289A|nr:MULTISPECIES: SIMPL domain-containing protein [unclassified Bacillus (in: firmicutes)]MDM5156274.1 SIMPL domain-containing protein [Bacillus sp. DX1.1]WJE80549.1 SIMPL domain-containing protein [Bacillus sp. DX3.1]
MQVGMNPYSLDIRNAKEATITVQGEGIVKVKPNVVVLTIGVRSDNKNVKQAQEENAIRSQQLLAALKQLGIADKDIETISYTITPQYEYINEKQLLQGYRVEHLYEITVLNVQKAGEVYDIAVTNGANVAKGLRFRVSHPNAYYQQALLQAVQHAQEKARAIASTYNLNINPVPLSLVEESAQSPREVVSYATLQAQAAPPIQSGELEIISSVRAIFTYL